MNQLVDPVGDALGGVAQQLHGPVGGVALGDVLGGGVVDQPLGQAGRQYELAVGDGDEAVAQRMEPELRPARLSDARIEMLDGFEVAGRADLGRKHPAARLPCELLPLGDPALQDGGELAGDRETPAVRRSWCGRCGRSWRSCRPASRRAKSPR